MEIMVVIAIIGLLSTIVYPAYARAREISMMQACINNLRQISNAKDAYAMDNNNKTPDMTDLVSTYLARNPICPAGGTYLVGVLDINAGCNVSSHTL